MKLNLLIATLLLTAFDAGAGKDLVGRPDKNAIKNLLPKNPFYLDQKTAAHIKQTLKIGDYEMMRLLYPIARQYARNANTPSKVGSVGMSADGRFIMGVNIEFPGIQEQSIHAEQAVVVNARYRGIRQLKFLTVGGEMCGTCRQFLSEIEPYNTLEFQAAGHSNKTLAQWFPSPYRSGRLKIPVNIMEPIGAHMEAGDQIKVLNKDPVADMAYFTARRSYTPYMQSPAGVAIEMRNGKIYAGPVLEISGSNGSLSPLKTAITALVAGNEKFNQIKDVVLVERHGAKITQEPSARMLLATLARKIKLRVFKLKY